LPNIEPYKIDLRELWEHLKWIAQRTIAIILLRTPQNFGTYWREKEKRKRKKVQKTMIRDKMWRIFGDKIMEELI
jgi:hypothetical protein